MGVSHRSLAMPHELLSKLQSPASQLGSPIWFCKFVHTHLTQLSVVRSVRSGHRHRLSQSLENLHVVLLVCGCCPSQTFFHLLARDMWTKADLPNAPLCPPCPGIPYLCFFDLHNIFPEHLSRHLSVHVENSGLGSKGVWGSLLTII